MILPAGSVLFSQGEEGNAMFLVKSGQVRVDRREGGEETEIARPGAGSIVGEMSLLDGQPRSATVTALVETEFVEIDRAQFERTLSSLPSWFSAIAKALVARLRATTARRHSSDLRSSLPAFVLLLRRPPAAGWTADLLCGRVHDIHGLSLREGRSVLDALERSGLVRIRLGAVEIPSTDVLEACWSRILDDDHLPGGEPGAPPSAAPGRELAALLDAWESSDEEFGILVAGSRSS